MLTTAARSVTPRTRHSVCSVKPVGDPGEAFRRSFSTVTMNLSLGLGLCLLALTQALPHYRSQEAAVEDLKKAAELDDAGVPLTPLEMEQEEAKLKRMISWKNLAGKTATALRLIHRILREESSERAKKDEEEDSSEEKNSIIPYDYFDNMNSKLSSNKTASKRFATKLIKPGVKLAADLLDGWSKSRRSESSERAKKDEEEDSSEEENGTNLIPYDYFDNMNSEPSSDKTASKRFATKLIKPGVKLAADLLDGWSKSRRSVDNLNSFEMRSRDQQEKGA